MESNSAGRRISARLRRAFKKWLPLFVLGFIATLAVRLAFLSERSVCSALVHLNYAGIESGADPNGNRFDPSEMKSAEVVRHAAEAMNWEATEELVERVQAAIEVNGEISPAVFEKVTENTSIFGEDAISEVEDIREAAYFPAHYTVKLHYADAGISAQDAPRFLSEFLTAYETFFYEKYGYHTAFEHSLNNADYQTYDYIDAVDVLGNHLTTLRSYLTLMNSQDHTHFVSKETGYSFQDLLDTLNTLQTENLDWALSYIVSNNMTKDREYLTNYYQYRIDDATRALAQQDSRLYTLNEQITKYVKTNAVFPIMGDGESTGSNEIAGQFEFTQPSAMYNSLINQKVDCQTSISSIREQIDMLNRRIDHLRAADSTGSAEVVEQRLGVVSDKINQLLSDVQRTSDEFYKSEWLEQAFQILKEPKTKAVSVGLFRTALDIFTVELMLFGLFLLFSLAGVRKEDSAAKRRAAKEEAAQ